MVSLESVSGQLLYARYNLATLLRVDGNEVGARKFSLLFTVGDLKRNFA